MTSDPQQRARLSLEGLSIGDADTNCAIVGGVVALFVGPAGLPPEWVERREPLPEWISPE